MKTKLLSNINYFSLVYFLTLGNVPRKQNLLNDSKLSNDFSYLFPEKIIETRRPFDEELKIFYQKGKEIMKEYVKKYKGPYGILLSGGIDSTALLHLLREVTDEDIYTTTMIFEETSTDTINLINEISEKYNTIQKFITLKEKDYCLLLDEIEKKYDNPIVLTFCTIIDYVGVRYLKSQGIKTIFSGIGDHFCCYEKNIYAYDIYKNIEGEIDKINDELKGFREWDSFYKRKDMKFINDFIKFKLGYFTLDEIDNLLGVPIENVIPNKQLEISKPENYGYISNIALFNCTTIFDPIFEHIQSLGKTFNVDMCTPYLSEKWIEYILNLPEEYKYNCFDTKHILRECFKGKIPSRIFYKNYSPANPNLRKMLLTKEVMEVLNDKFDYLNKIGIFKKSIEIKSFLQGDVIENELKILILVSLGSWLQGKNI